MHLDITTRHASTTDDVKRHAQEKVEQALRHADGVLSVHVILDVERERHMAEFIVHGRNLSAAVHADSTDMWTSIDRCAEKLRHQLEHVLGRQRDRRRRQPGLARQEAEIAAREAAEAEAAAAEAQGAEAEEAAAEVEAAAPSIVRLPVGSLETMTENEAWTRLQGGQREFLVFRDGGGAVCVLYRRRDGHFGLIETGARA